MKFADIAGVVGKIKESRREDLDSEAVSPEGLGFEDESPSPLCDLN